MINEKVLEEFNKQINEETYSAYLYLSMSAWFESINLTGFASWMRVQVQEEMVHAMKFYHHVIERGGAVKLTAIEGPATEWESPLAAFEGAYAHEQHISGRINLLVDVATEAKDYASLPFLQWFVGEQVEEEATADGVVQQLKLVAGAPGGLFMLDREMGQRVFMPPPAEGG
jgi:ferritin